MPGILLAEDDDAVHNVLRAVLDRFEVIAGEPYGKSSAVSLPKTLTHSSHTPHADDGFHRRQRHAPHHPKAATLVLIGYPELDEVLSAFAHATEYDLSESRRKPRCRATPAR